jgi:hypothetical protein
LLRASSSALHEVTADGAHTLTLLPSSVRLLLRVRELGLPQDWLASRRQRPPSSTAPAPVWDWKPTRTHSADAHSVRDAHGSHSLRDLYFTVEHLCADKMQALPLQVGLPSTHSTHLCASVSQALRPEM